MSRVLCTWAELEARGSIAFSHEGRRVIAVATSTGPKAYADACPHTGQSLDGGEGGADFLTFERDALICRWHGALFYKTTGACFAGPCAGRALSPVPVRRDGGDVVL